MALFVAMATATTVVALSAHHLSRPVSLFSDIFPLFCHRTCSLFIAAAAASVSPGIIIVVLETVIPLSVILVILENRDV